MPLNLRETAQSIPHIHAETEDDINGISGNSDTTLTSQRGNALLKRGIQVTYAAWIIGALIAIPYILFGLSDKVGGMAGGIFLLGLGFRSFCEYGRGQIDGVIQSWYYGAKPVYKADRPLAFKGASANQILGGLFYTGLGLFILYASVAIL